MQSLHGSLAMPGMHLTPVSGSTLHVFFAVMHKVEVGSLSQGPSSHILSIFVLSSSVHLPASTSASNVASVPGHENLLSVWHMAVSSKTRGSPAALSTGANGASGGAESTSATIEANRGPPDGGTPMENSDGAAGATLLKI